MTTCTIDATTNHPLDIAYTPRPYKRSMLAVLVLWRSYKGTDRRILTLATYLYAGDDYSATRAVGPMLGFMATVPPAIGGMSTCARIGAIRDGVYQLPVSVLYQYVMHSSSLSLGACKRAIAYVTMGRQVVGRGSHDPRSRLAVMLGA